MNRRNLFLVILLAVQLALLAILSFTNGKGDAQRLTFLAGVTPERITGLEIDGEGGKGLRLARAADGWRITSQDNLPVEQERIDKALATLTALSSNQLVTRTSESHGRFLVAEQRFRQRLTVRLGDGSKKVLYLGSAPSFKATHVRLEGDQRIFLVRDFSALDLPLEAASWWKSGYVDVPEDTLTRIRIANSHGTLVLSRQPGGKWEMTEPKGTVDPARAQALVDKVRRIVLSEYLGQEDKDAHGLKTPTATLSLTTEAGEIVLRVGAADPSGTGLVIKSSASPSFARASKAALAGVLDARAEALLLGSAPTPAKDQK
ncbi:MAG: DUF4340 domain-containing protein [Thermodesulfobacteriota bacterium]